MNNLEIHYKKREVSFLLIIIALILSIQFTAHLYLTKFNILPMVQGDMGGYAYIWLEKIVSGHIIHLYSPSKSSTFPPDLNNPFLSIMPALIMRLIRTLNMYEGIFILYLEVSIIAFISMYILLREWSKDSNLSVFAALLYAFSPLTLGIYFIPALRLAYALLPLGFLPIVHILKAKLENMKIKNSDVIRDIMILLFVSTLVSWTHIEIFILYLLVFTFLTLIVTLWMRDKRMIFLGIIFVVVMAVTGALPIVSSHYVVNPVFRSSFIKFREAIEPSPYAYLENFIEYIGLCDYDSLSYLSYLTSKLALFEILYNGYVAYVYVFSIIILATISVYLIFSISNTVKKNNQSIQYFSVTSLITLLIIASYAVYKHWGIIRYFIIDHAPMYTPFSVLRDFVIIYRTPARLNGVIAPLIFIVFVQAVKSTSRVIKDYFIRTNASLYAIKATFKRKNIRVLLILLALVLNIFSLICPGTFNYLHHLTRSTAYGFEWPWTDISYIHNILYNHSKLFKYRMLDYTVYEPHYVYLGSKFFSFDMRNDLDLLELYRIPNWDNLLQELGIKYVAISNWTSRWFFVGRDLNNIMNRELTKLVSHDNITVYCTSCGKVQLWVKVPEISPHHFDNLIVALGSLKGGIAKQPFKPLYTEKSRPLWANITKLSKIILRKEEFTIEAVVKLNSLGLRHDQWIAVVSKKYSWENKGFGLFYGWGADLYFNVGNWSYYAGTTVYDWNEFHKIVAVYDHGILRLYVDNNLVALRKTNRKLILSRPVLYIGGRPDGLYKLNGTILGVDIFPYALNPLNIEIKTIRQLNNYISVQVFNHGNITLKNQWIKITVPILKSNETITGVFLRRDRKLAPLEFYIISIKKPAKIKWIELKKPALLLGGAVSLAFFESFIGKSTLVPVYLREIPNSYFLTELIKDKTPIFIVNMDPIDLLLVLERYVHQNISTQIINLCKYYLPTRLATLKGFGISYYSKPFFGVIPSDTYGDFSLSSYQIFIPATTRTYAIKIPKVTLQKGSYNVLLRLTVEGRAPYVRIILYINKDAITIRTLSSKGYKYFTGWVNLGSIKLKHDKCLNIKIDIIKNHVGLHLDSLAFIPTKILQRIVQINRKVLLNITGKNATNYVIANTLLPISISYSDLCIAKVQPYIGYGTLGSVYAKAIILNAKYPRAASTLYSPVNIGKASFYLYLIESAPRTSISVTLRSVSSGMIVLKKTFTVPEGSKEPLWFPLKHNLKINAGMYEIILTINRGKAIVGAVALSSLALSKVKNTFSREISLAVTRKYLSGDITIKLRMNPNVIEENTLFIYVKEPFYVYTYSIDNKLLQRKMEVLPAYGIFTLLAIKIPHNALNNRTALELEIEIVPKIKFQFPFVFFSILSVACIIILLIYPRCITFIKSRFKLRKFRGLRCNASGK